SSGKANISYYDTVNGDLKYAANTSGSWVTTIMDSTGNVGQYTSIALDSSDMVHISYYDYTNDNLKYATNVVQTPTPIPTATPTPTPTPSATPSCQEAVFIEASPTELTLNKKVGNVVTVTVTGDDGCPVEGDTVKARIDSNDEELIKVSPKKQTTDANGEAVFMITAKNKAGNAAVKFKDGELSTQVNVTVVK
ncbi:MAG: hypothetical protein AAB013_00265, partial [Planctomycetota bacterium]